MTLTLTDYAKEGLIRLKGGSPGIIISALNKKDLNYLLEYYKKKGFDAQKEKAISKEGVGTIYPISVFHKIFVGVNKNA